MSSVRVFCWLSAPSPAFWWFSRSCSLTNIHIDDPVGATSVHLGCGVFGTLCVGLFAEEGVTSSVPGRPVLRRRLRPAGRPAARRCRRRRFHLRAARGGLAGPQNRPSASGFPERRSCQGLDIGEHGNVAYPDFPPVTEQLTTDEDLPLVSPAIRRSPTTRRSRWSTTKPRGAKITKVTILDQPAPVRRPAGRAGEAGHHRHHRDQRLRLRRSEGPHRLLPRQLRCSSRLLPKVKIDIVVCKSPGRDAHQDRPARPSTPATSATARSSSTTSRTSSRSAPANGGMTPSRMSRAKKSKPGCAFSRPAV